MGLPIEDSVEIFLGQGWGNISEYITKMEAYLLEATDQFVASVGEVGENNVGDYQFYRDEFPYILRNSFFVSAYSLLEFDIDFICKELKTKKKIPINLSDLSGDLMKRLKLYFKLAAVEYPFNNKIWEEINNYSKLRNCIVHSNGLLKKDDKDYEALIKYVKEKSLAKERYIISDEAAELEIGLTKAFCEEAVDTMEKFIDSAYKESIRRLEK